MKYRALVRVLEIQNEVVIVVVPGWNPHEKVEIPLAVFPAGVAPDCRYHAQINMSAKVSFDLDPTDWEWI